MNEVLCSASAAAKPLPQTQGKLFLTDGGLETTLLFHDGIDLRCFASIDMLRKPGGREHLKRYFETYLAIAHLARSGFILESATWRASPDWAEPLGVSLDELDRLNREAIRMLHELRLEHETEATPIVISGCIGPRGDGYDPGAAMSAEAAEAYHGWQLRILAESGVDMIAAITMTNLPEAIGIARAARAAGLPVAISFTLETDGRLPTGEKLGAAIEAVDGATEGYPAYYMINCAHPTHFASTLAEGGAWLSRIRGIRANASKRSHAELDEASELDCGDPDELGADYKLLLDRYPQINVIGGCCGTDHRHVDAMARAIALEGAN